MIGITANSDAIEPRLRAVAAELGNGAVASRNGCNHVVTLIRTHLAGLAASRHVTASRLGASPTGHIRAQAARCAMADDKGALITVGIPGIGRAYHDIEIRPKSSSALTIPVHRLAYGKTVSELKRSRTIFRPQGKDYLATTEEDGTITVLYLLRKVVRQPRDPSLLPSREQLSYTYAEGWRAAIRLAMQRRGA